MDQRKRMAELDTNLDANYWNTRYLDAKIGWDIGYANPVLMDFVKINYTKNTKILIPGCGNGYELEELYKLGFKQCYGLDLSEKAKQDFLARVPGFPSSQYLISDFFKLDQKFDLILEQTFFCALDPGLREEYVTSMKATLKDKGCLAGLLFNFDKKNGPPFGGSIDEYNNLFNSDFEIVTMKECTKSIEPRMGSEVFFKLFKKK